MPSACPWTAILCVVAIAAPLSAVEAAAAVLPESVATPAADVTARSAKRGVCANHLSDKDFRAVAPGVSWFYNWYHQTGDSAPAELGLAFLPMVWGNGPERLAGLESWLAAGNKPLVVLAINEPNLKGQAFIPPAVCADLFARTAAIATRYGIPTVGPHMAIGSAPGDSITADDPIEQKPVTYTWMVPYLKAFMHYAKDTPVAGLGVHAYGDIHELRWSVEATWKEFQRPVWVTEFAQWGAKDEAAELDYLIQAVDFLERSPHVAGYAWFKERSDNNRISLFTKEDGELTVLGRAYVGMPRIDAAIRHAVPGRIEAEAALTLSEYAVRATGDGEGLAELRADKSGASATIRLDVAKAGPHRLAVRARNGGPGSVAVSIGKRKLGTVQLTGGDWETAAAEVTLPKGACDLTLTVNQAGTAINWLDLQAAP